MCQSRVGADKSAKPSVTFAHSSPSGYYYYYLKTTQNELIQSRCVRLFTVQLQFIFTTLTFRIDVKIVFVSIRIQRSEMVARTDEHLTRDNCRIRRTVHSNETEKGGRGNGRGVEAESEQRRNGNDQRDDNRVMHCAAACILPATISAVSADNEWVSAEKHFADILDQKKWHGWRRVKRNLHRKWDGHDWSAIEVNGAL